MIVIYHLYPPFFLVPEEGNFADAWESFCCKMLCLVENTDEIYRRNFPEQGIDLYYPTKKIAYQCKSVNSGKSGDFNVTKAINSIKSAKKVKNVVGWEKYAICTNVDITGASEVKIREELSDAIIHPKSYWQNLCEKYHQYVERNFRIILDIPPKRLMDTLNDSFYSGYSYKMKKDLKKDSIDIFLYSNRQDKIYRLPVSPYFKVKDLLQILRGFFKLPESDTFESEQITVSIRHSIVINGMKQAFSKTLQELGVVTGDIITYWTNFVWKDESDEFEGDVIHIITLGALERRDPRLRAQKAIEKFEKEVQRAFHEFDKSLKNDNGGN